MSNDCAPATGTATVNVTATFIKYKQWDEEQEFASEWVSKEFIDLVFETNMLFNIRKRSKNICIK